MKKIVLPMLFVCFTTSISFAFSVAKNPFAPLVKSQSASLGSSITSIPTSNFTIKMVMWGSLKGALLEDSTGMVYVVKEGTKIGQDQVIKIMPNEVILKTPYGIKKLSLKNPNNIVSQSKNQNDSSITNKGIQDTSSKTLSNEVKP